VEGEREQMPELKTGMNEGAYGYFIAGLRLAIKDAGYKFEKDFAEGIMNPVTLSKNLNYKYRMGEENVIKCAKKLNKDVSEIVLLGKQAESGEVIKEPTTISQAVPGVQAGYVNPMDVLSAVSTLINQYQKNDERMRYWRHIFDALPVATLIIKDGLVIYQNIKASSWGNLAGSPLCDKCAGKGCEDSFECLYRIIETIQPNSGYQRIAGIRYKIDITPTRLNDHEYFIVVATKPEYDGFDHRRGSDRRSIQRLK
jgi:hypothetical protein